MIDCISDFENALEQADKGRTLVESLNEERGVLVLCPDDDIICFEAVKSHIDELVGQFGRVVVIIPEAINNRFTLRDDVRTVPVHKKEMDCILRYASLAEDIDTSIKIVSFDKEISGRAFRLIDCCGFDKEQVIRKGLLGIMC